MTGSLLEMCLRIVESIPLAEWRGMVTHVRGTTVESRGPLASVGESCSMLRTDGRHTEGEVIGFRGETVVSMPIESAEGLRFGDQLLTHRQYPVTPVGDCLIGRVIDPRGLPLDHCGAIHAAYTAPVRARAPKAMDRAPIRESLACGVRAIDGFLTCGRGQRVGIFGGSGVGKSTLIGMMVKNTAADVVVLALVGERGREVREFLENALGAAGRKRAVVVVATSDESPLLRIRAANTATAIAEEFRTQGKHVLLIMDSVTRLAMAQREIGLAAGEPPTAKGYTPSVFAHLAGLVERAGTSNVGSITAFYTVLMEGDDQMDPIVDAVRSLLDGHIILDRRLATEGHYPPINVLESVSRLMPNICSRSHLNKVDLLRRAMSVYARSEDLIKIGAYQRGTFAELDSAIALIPKIANFLRQTSGEITSFDETIRQLLSLDGDQ
jgi:flagellum-specific ATP synthase